MTPQEFKAWFEGFTEAFTGVPTKAQWARVKDRVSEIDGKPVTERVFVDRYWPTYVPNYPTWRYLSMNGPIGAVGAAGNNTVQTLANCGQAAVSNTYQQAVSNFNSSQAMADLGRADAKALAS